MLVGAFLELIKIVKIPHRIKLKSPEMSHRTEQYSYYRRFEAS